MARLLPTAQRGGAVAEIGLDHARIARDALRRALGDDAALGQHIDALGQADDRLHHVLDQKDRDAAVADGADDRDHVADLRRVEPGQHLVEQEQLRLGRKRARKLEALAAGDRQARGRLIELRASPTRRATCFGRGQRVARAPADDRCAPTAMFSRTVSAANGCTIWNVRAMPRAQQVRRQAGDVRAIEADAARVGRTKAGDRREQRGLARAVRADQRDDLALRDVKRCAVDRRSPPKRFASSRPQASAQPWRRSAMLAGAAPARRARRQGRSAGNARPRSARTP